MSPFFIPVLNQYLIVMTKAEQIRHRQILINHYNQRLNELEESIIKCNPLNESFLIKQKNILLKRLAKLYGTEEYGLVQA